MPRTLVLAALLLAANACVAADEQALSGHRERLKQKWEAQFRAADANQDRLLTREEIAAAKLPDSLVSRFDEIDANHDGGLSPEELWAVYDKRLAAQRHVVPPTP